MNPEIHLAYLDATDDIAMVESCTTPRNIQWDEKRTGQALLKINAELTNA